MPFPDLFVEVHEGLKKKEIGDLGVYRRRNEEEFKDFGFGLPEEEEVRVLKNLELRCIAMAMLQFRISKLITNSDITTKLVLPTQILVHIPIMKGKHICFGFAGWYLRFEVHVSAIGTDLHEQYAYLVIYVMAAEGIFAGFINGWYYDDPHNNILDIKLQLLASPNCKIVFVPRNANMAAHCLAKLGLSVVTDCFWLEEDPPSLAAVVLGDCPSLL
ncbi:hypothetical protein EZV62_006376 [Acer yangbiense]|uniref:RNase H type-1 domain-containing protein n=1 Tax=Acer yangbiense TaxID=1000413 RepID=A0A5C7I7A5_9ROSI|nr:hypothetical protein EZV62_006376 [Acer yangbiense]